MTEILTALGLMFLLEGALYAAFPRGMRNMLGKIAEMNDGQIRMLGLVSATLGFLLVAFMRLG